MNIYAGCCTTSLQQKKHWNVKQNQGLTFFYYTFFGSKNKEGGKGMADKILDMDELKLKKLQTKDQTPFEVYHSL